MKMIEAHEVEDVSVFPMAMPMIAGPGSIASIMLLMSKGTGIERTLIILAALARLLVVLGVRSTGEPRRGIQERPGQ